MKLIFLCYDESVCFVNNSVKSDLIYPKWCNWKGKIKRHKQSERDAWHEAVSISCSFTVCLLIEVQSEVVLYVCVLTVEITANLTGSVAFPQAYCLSVALKGRQLHIETQLTLTVLWDPTVDIPTYMLQHAPSFHTQTNVLLKLHLPRNHPHRANTYSITV